jgi:hypothetical protein
MPAAIYATGGCAAGSISFWPATHDDHARETGRLAAQALIDTLIVTEVLNMRWDASVRILATARAISLIMEILSSGHASTSGPSHGRQLRIQHHPWIKYGAFAIAAAVSMSRYTGRNHFLSMFGRKLDRIWDRRFVYKTR